jgi:hypothetical protein
MDMENFGRYWAFDDFSAPSITFLLSDFFNSVLLFKRLFLYLETDFHPHSRKLLPHPF